MYSVRANLFAERLKRVHGKAADQVLRFARGSPANRGQATLLGFSSQGLFRKIHIVFEKCVVLLVISSSVQLSKSINLLERNG